MTQCFHRYAAAFVLTLMVQPAVALTPEEAWASLQGYTASTGVTATVTSTERAGDTLTVSGVTMASVSDVMSTTTTVSTIVFRDRGDNTVEVIYPPAYDVAFTAGTAEAGAGPKSFVISMELDKTVIIASGSAEATVFDFSAVSLSGSIGQFIDWNDQPVNLSGKVILNGVTGKYTLHPAAKGVAQNGSFTANTLLLTVENTAPDLDRQFALTLSGTDVASTGTTAIGDITGLAAGDLTSLLAAGFDIDSRITTGPLALSLKTGPNGTHGAVDATLTGSDLHVALNADRMDYGIGLMGGAVDAAGFDIPLPHIASAFGEMAFGWTMPLTDSDEPQDFSGLIKLVDLTLTEEVWAIFDPGQRLPRDPVTFIVDVDGKAARMAALFAPMIFMVTPEPQPQLQPGKLFSLDLTQVLVRAAGAQVAAVGGLTFDNDRIEARGGIPDPAGTITVTLDGINPLMDALVAIGLVSSDDLMSARMGLAMMTRPGSGPDQLVSDVEFRDGGMFVNGQQMF
ncbi:MAG: DUF2125 domain-containing protein [Paracoccaceae bacterium]